MLHVKETGIEVLLLLPGWDASPLKGYRLPPFLPAVCHWYPFIYLGRERQRGMKFLD